MRVYAFPRSSHGIRHKTHPTSSQKHCTALIHSTGPSILVFFLFRAPHPALRRCQTKTHSSPSCYDEGHMFSFEPPLQHPAHNKLHGTAQTSPASAVCTDRFCTLSASYPTLVALFVLFSCYLFPAATSILPTELFAPASHHLVSTAQGSVRIPL